MRERDDIDRQMDELYERYGKPLEAEHWGRFLAVHPDGGTLMGDSFNETALQAADVLGPGVFLFRIGDRVVGKIR